MGRTQSCHLKLEASVCVAGALVGNGGEALREACLLRWPGLGPPSSHTLVTLSETTVNVLDKLPKHKLLLRNLPHRVTGCFSAAL